VRPEVYPSAMLRFHQATCELLWMPPVVDLPSRAAIAERERRLGVKLPASVAEWYSLPGAVNVLVGATDDHAMRIEELGEPSTAGARVRGTCWRRDCLSSGRRTRGCATGPRAWTTGSTRGCWSRWTRSRTWWSGGSTRPASRTTCSRSRGTGWPSASRSGWRRRTRRWSGETWRCWSGGSSSRTAPGAGRVTPTTGSSAARGGSSSGTARARRTGGCSHRRPRRWRDSPARCGAVAGWPRRCTPSGRDPAVQDVAEEVLAALRAGQPGHGAAG